MFKFTSFVLTFFLLNLVCCQVTVVELQMLPPAHLKVASPNDTLTFTGEPINSYAKPITFTRNLTKEVEADYRLEMIGMCLESELGNLTAEEKGFIEGRDFRKKKMKAYQVWLDPEVDANFTQSRAQTIKRLRLRKRQGNGSGFATLESSWLMLMAPNAAATYCPNNDIAQWNCPACRASKFNDLTNIRVITKRALCGEIQAYVGFSPKNQAIIVSFRGSQNAGNWLCNLDAVTCNTRLSIGGKVHCGFQNSWNTVRNEVFRAIMDIASPFWPNGASLAYPVFFVGHSLGGAMATFAAVDFLDTEGFKVGYTASNIGLLTYGSPRIFDNTASNNFGNKRFGVSFRAVHHKDPIPHLPYQFMAYKHVFREIFQRFDERKVTCNDSPQNEATNCANSVIAANLVDHFSFGGIPLGCGSSFGSLPDDARCIDFNGKTINCDA